jgi:hypothetical protein
MFHFSLANAAGAGQENVPRLLRRLARNIDILGPMEVHDITYQVDVSANGTLRPSMTVYYSLSKGKRPTRNR